MSSKKGVTGLGYPLRPTREHRSDAYKRVQMIRFSTNTSPIGALIRLSSGKLSRVMTHGARLQARRPMISVIRYVNSVSPASYLSILATP